LGGIQNNSRSPYPPNSRMLDCKIEALIYETHLRHHIDAVFVVFFDGNIYQNSFSRVVHPGACNFGVGDG
jgi:hypothetical protein